MSENTNNDVKDSMILSITIVLVWCIFLITVNSCQKRVDAINTLEKQIKHTQKMERMRLDKCVWK